MKQTVVITALLLAGLSIHSSATKPLPPGELTLTITSADSDKEVNFEGAFVVNSDSRRSIVVSETTPYVFQTTSELLSGVFSSIDSSSRIKVSLDATRTDYKGMNSGSATGTVILLNRGVSNQFKDYIMALR